MSWSFRLGRVRGIDIKIHYTFLFLLALALLLGGDRSFGQAAGRFVLIVLLFGCVLLHELGHSVVAQAHGIRVRDITLLPIGGIARLEAVPENPWTELKIAIAGPAVNLGIFILLAPLVVLTFIGAAAEIPFMAAVATGPIGSVLLWLCGANLALMAFNLLPAFPLDGGRVLRALLAMRMDFVRATVIAARVGKVLAIGLILVGVLDGLGITVSGVGVIGGGGLIWLIVIGAFIFLAGANEVRLVRLRRWHRTLPLGDGTELIPPGVPDEPPPEVGRGLLFDFGVYNRREVMEEFQRLIRRMQGRA